MKKITRNLLLVYFGIVLVKVILFSFIKVPSAYADYYVYAKMAQSFFHSGVFQIHGVDTFLRPPLYPILLSVSYFFKDMNNVFFSMKIINALISTSIIIPSYLLAREFLSKKKSLVIALLIGVLPSTFAFSVYLMSENLFYPLFMFSIFFLYKSFSSSDYYWDVLAGITIGLSFLTRTIGIVLIPIAVSSFVFYSIYRRRESIFQLKKKFMITLVFLAVLSPWLLRNFNHFGYSLSAILGVDASEATAAFGGTYTLSAFLTLLVFYLAFVILSSGIVFFISNLSIFKRSSQNENYFILMMLVFSSLFFSLIIAANHNPGAVKYVLLYSWYQGKFVGRYIDYVLPLIFLSGFVGLKYLKEDRKVMKYGLIVISVLLVYSSQIVFTSLYPVNNLSLSWVGFMNFIFNFLVHNTISITNQYSISNTLFFSLFFLVLSVFAYHVSQIKINKIVPYFFIFFLLVSLLSLSMTKYDSDKLFDAGQTKLGVRFNDYDSDKYSRILIDERDRGVINKKVQEGIYSGREGGYSLIGFWMNDEIKIGDINYLDDVDYVVTKDDLDYLLVDSEDGVRIYMID